MERIDLLKEDLKLLQEVKELREPLKLEKTLARADRFHYLDEYLFWLRHKEISCSFEEHLINEIKYIENKENK